MNKVCNDNEVKRRASLYLDMWSKLQANPNSIMYQLKVKEIDTALWLRVGELKD